MALSDSLQRGYPPEVTGEDISTANDRFKKSHGSRFWSAFIIATLLHMAVFALWPEMTAAVPPGPVPDPEIIEFAPDVEIPPTPKDIIRPRTPVMATTDVDPDITIGVTNIDAYEPDELPPPPDLRETQKGSPVVPFFTPWTVLPEIRNRGEVQRALEREYPPLLRDAGIGGTVLVWFYIDDAGGIERTHLHTSSGHRALDEAALRVAEVIDFTPALNRDKRVPVWISLPISFRIR